MSRKKSAPAPRGPEQIVADLAAAKKAENALEATRIQLEAELISALGFDKIEGGTSYEVGDYKVVVAAKLTRKVGDVDEFVEACAAIPRDMRPYSTEVKVSQTGLKYLAANEPEMFEKIARHVVTAPAKTSVSISRL